MPELLANSRIVFEQKGRFHKQIIEVNGIEIFENLLIAGIYF